MGGRPGGLLAKALAAPASGDRRRAAGEERQGRTLARAVSDRVRRDAADPPAQHDACRHDWIGLGEDWERWLRTPLTQEDRDAVEGWRRRGLPLVVAAGSRQTPLTTCGSASPAGQAADRRPRGVLRRRDPRRSACLAAVLASAPAVWWPLLASVLLAADALGVPVHVFGSLAWQHWSGQEYVRPVPTSICCSPRRWTEVERLLAELQSLCGRAVPRLDGEVLLPTAVRSRGGNWPPGPPG